MKKANDFYERVYEKLKEVPAGYVTTYKYLAHAVGSNGYRAVGNAMNKNPHLIVVPCHRVVCSDGTLGGYATGLNKKVTLLKKEGVSVVDGKVSDFEGKLWRF